VSRVARPVADAMATVSLVLLVIGVVMSFPADSNAVVSDVVQGFGFVVCFGGVGWVLVRRLPRNPIGWWFSLGALFTALTFLAHGEARSVVASVAAPDALARAAAVVDTWGWMLAIPFAVPLPLLYLPNGRLPSTRWQPIVWVVLGGSVLGTVGALTTAGPISNPLYPSLVNPMGVSRLGTVPHLLFSFGFLTLVAGALLGMLALALRFRGSSGVERQQLLWVAVGGLCGVVGILFGGASQDAGAGGVIGGIGAGLGVGAVPVCLGIAVLRYRLYDLGRVVSRTVSYAVITALLVGFYLVLVTASTSLLPHGSSLAVAASTLAAAALFQPLRRRVQTLVDRKFNRARYDADRTVDAFTRTLRADVALDAVRADLLRAVSDTLQPSSVGLWLRPTDEVRR
jgi:hypothetical protein